MRVLGSKLWLMVVLVIVTVLAQANETGKLLILQIGAATDGNISHSFVELYNNSDQPINLSGYSLQYAAGTKVANNATEDGPWNKIDLSETISPKHSFLILGKKGSTASPERLIADGYGDINKADFELSNRAVKVALMSNTILLEAQNPFDIDNNGTKANGYVDMVGAINDNTDKLLGFEGASPTVRITKQVGVRRKSLIDTDNNGTDFENITYASITAEAKELNRPKNHAHGAWSPFPVAEEDPTPGICEQIETIRDLPVIRINTQNGAEIANREDWVNMTFALTDHNNPQNDICKIQGNDQIRGRGNTTWSYPKKPYRVRFRDDVSLFGHAARRNWVLLAEYMDPTFLMNATAFELGREVFELPYTLTYQHVHLYLNGEYQGVYGVTEHRQADPNGVGAPGRVKVDLNEGWFVELDLNWDEEPKFITLNYDLPIMIKSPEFSGNSDDMRYNFVKDDWNELTALMASEDFPKNGYRDLIDMNAFVDYLMANEIVRNWELEHPKSVFAYKDKDGKISMGPLWDFDWAYCYGGGHMYFGCAGDRPSSYWHRFFRRLFNDPIFLVKYKERWNEKYNEIAAVSEFIETLGEKIRNAVIKDSEKWKIDGGYYPDYDTDHARQVGLMINWWNKRVDRLNIELNKVQAIPSSKNFGTVPDDTYSEIFPQTFTFVAYGDMEDLSATLQNAAESSFEISTELSETDATGNGGYLATISVNPKEQLSAGIHTDVLVLSGTNQEKPFELNVSLKFTVDPILTQSNIRRPQIAKGSLFAYAKNNSITLGNLPVNAKVEVYNISGKLISSKSLNQVNQGSDYMQIEVQAKGIYLVKVGKQTIRVPVM